MRQHHGHLEGGVKYNCQCVCCITILFGVQGGPLRPRCCSAAVLVDERSRATERLRIPTARACVIARTLVCALHARGACACARTCVPVRGHDSEGSISALSRHRRRHVHCAGMGAPVPKMTASHQYPRNGGAVIDAEIEPI